jgi:AraC-like DNA-binding protein
VTRRSFWLQGSAWEYPDFEKAERQALSRRSAQRHFLQATGITYGAYRQIERARHAATLLQQRVSILDTVHQAGYFDQAHLTRSLRRLIGETPARLREQSRQLSFLYKTSPVGRAYFGPSDSPSIA